MSPSIPRDAATAPILPDGVSPTKITPGVMFRQRATDDNRGASSVGDATMPPSIPRDAAMAPTLPEGVAPTNITPGLMLEDEADESILFLRPHGRRTTDDSVTSTSTTTSQKAAPSRPGQLKDGAAAARLFSNDSATGDDKAPSEHTTQFFQSKHVVFAPPLQPTKAVRVLFPLESRGAPNLHATDAMETAPVTLIQTAHNNPDLSSATLEV